jgi:hypothetical protein
MKIFVKIFSLVIILLFVVLILSIGKVYDQKNLQYGVTFSAHQARDLGLDWQDFYQRIFSELGVKQIRLVAYWDEIESNQNNYNWEDLDWEIKTAGVHQAKIILAIGGRLPRWPECHYPAWTNNLDEVQKQAATLAYIKKTIERYKGDSSVVAWQIENEPFLSHFGECPELNKDFLDKEIALAKSLDTRPIVITDSGELSIWIPAAQRADIFGTTMYRDTYSNVLKRYVHYPLNPGFFRLKRNLASWFAHPQQWIVIELQAEPWGPKPFQELSQADRDRTMSLQKFKDIIEFSRQAGFQKFYLWGVEYWYWDMVHNGNSGMWNEARTLFNR